VSHEPVERFVVECGACDTGAEMAEGMLQQQRGYASSDAHVEWEASVGFCREALCSSREVLPFTVAAFVVGAKVLSLEGDLGVCEM